MLVIKTLLNQFLLLMYTHAYTQYVNHILNKSPSKAAYTFTKAQRFPPSKSQYAVQQPFLQANGFQYRDGAKKYAYLPNQNAEADRSKSKKKKQDDSFVLLKKEYYVEPKKNNPDVRKNGAFTRSKSKSPLRPQTEHPTNRQNRKYNDYKQENKMQEFAEKYPPSQAKAVKSGATSKSPLKPHNKSTNSPNKTFTQQLHQTDHISKNITANGYYPTGYQLSPKGKYAISKVRDTPAYKFGKSSPGLRYNYMAKSEDTLGPGFYKDFSQFGQIKK